jgi:UPF0755 protein
MAAANRAASDMHSRRRWLWLALALILAVALGAAWLWRQSGAELTRPGPLAESLLFEISSGQGQRQILQRLQSAGALRDARRAEIVLRAAGLRPVFKTGRYRLQAGASLRQIVDQLALGQVELESITLVEGWTFAMARAAVEGHPALEASLRGRSDAEVMAALGQPDVPPEGRLFPDTYRFAAGTRDVQIYRQAAEALQKQLQASWSARSSDLPIKSPDEALVLASIVEKETGAADERPLIAAVFVNRLRERMRLQSDPTVIYGLGSNYDGNIRVADLRTDTAYNTYTRSGLPPTPIALPGLASLQAVTRPAKSDARYFVATGKGDGRHVFNSGYPEHQKAVAAMLRNQRAAGISR